MTSCRWLLLWLLSVPAFAGAAELRSVTLEKRDGLYYATSEIWLDADRESLYQVLSNWDISTRFSSLIVASRNLEEDEQGRSGFYMKNRACVIFFCKTVERYGYMENEEGSLVRAIAIAEKSDFDISDERWFLEPEGDGTRIRYEMTMKPKFWIPPIVGPYAIKKKIRKDGVEALERIEQYVRENANSDNDSDE